MNNLLDFAGLLLYYIVLPFLLPIQALLYGFAGLWFAFAYGHRVLLEIPKLWSWLRQGVHKMHMPAWRRKLVKVHA